MTDELPPMAREYVEELLRMVIVLARNGSAMTTPVRGDLVFETSGMRPIQDPDGIGWLLGEGMAAYREGEDADRVSLHEKRHVWDVLPLNPFATLQPWGGQRWENATFYAVPPRIMRRLGMVCPALPVREGDDE